MAITIDGDGAITGLSAGGLPNNSVQTADIADDQITLAKLAGGTDGQIITYDASGNPVAVGPGSDGQVLTSTGAGSPPAFEAITSVDTNALAKAWITFSGDTSNTTRDHYNIASVTDNGAGDYTFTFDTDFANINYCGACTQSFQWQRNSNLTGSGFASLLAFRYRAVGSCRVQNVQASGGSHMDIDDLNIVWFGDQ